MRYYIYRNKRELNLNTIGGNLGCFFRIVGFMNPKEGNEYIKNGIGLENFNLED